MMSYDFQSMSELKSTDSLKMDLYQVMLLELGHFIEKTYHLKMDDLCNYYDNILYENYEREVQIYARISSSIKECNDKTLIDYISYFNRNFNKSFFSHSYVKETETTMRILTKFDGMINKFALDVMVKYSLMDSADDKDPYLAITLYFERASNPIYGNFEEFLNACEKVIADIIR